MRLLLFSCLFILLGVVRFYGDVGGLGSYLLGVVDVDVVFRSHPSLGKVRLELKAMKSESEEKVNKKREEILSLEKGFEEQRGSLSENDFRLQLGMIEARKEGLRVFIMSENKHLKRRARDLKKPLLREVFSVIEELRKERGYLVVMHKEDLVSFDSRVDLTYDVVTRLKEGS